MLLRIYALAIRAWVFPDMGETPMPRLPAVPGGTGVPPVC